MTFFKMTSIFLGGYFILVIVAHVLFANKFQPFFIQIFLPEKRPRWVFPFTIVYTLFTLYAWVRLFQSGFFLASMLTTMILSFGVMKLFLYATKYDLLRTAALQLLTKEKLPLMILLGLGFAVGVLLLVAGLRM